VKKIGQSKMGRPRRRDDWRALTFLIEKQLVERIDVEATKFRRSRTSEMAVLLTEALDARERKAKAEAQANG